MTTPAQASTALDEYGPLAQIVQAVPDLSSLLTSAIQNQWTPAHLQASIMATPWYQQHSDTARSLLMTAAADPGAWHQQFQSAINLIQEVAGSMGRAVDNGPGVSSIAYQYLANGWTSADLQRYLGSSAAITNDGANSFAGQAGQIQAHLEQTAQSYGVPYTQSMLSTWANKIQSGMDTTDGFDQLMRTQAKSQFPQYAAQIDAGQTLSQIADPYMAQMAKTLEIPQSSVTLDNPAIQKALSVRDPQSGAVTSQSMWQFTQQLKNDPRYDQTTQAKTDAYSTLAQIGKDFGFNGGTGGVAAAAGAGQ